LKGLMVGTVRCLLFEYQEFTLVNAITEPCLQRVRVVDSWEFEGDGYHWTDLYLPLSLMRWSERDVVKVFT
jgi:hypothetical protein